MAKNNATCVQFAKAITQKQNGHIEPLQHLMLQLCQITSQYYSKSHRNCAKIHHSYATSLRHFGCMCQNAWLSKHCTLILDNKSHNSVDVLPAETNEDLGEFTSQEATFVKSWDPNFPWYLMGVPGRRFVLMCFA